MIPCLCSFRFSSCAIHHEKSPQTEWSGGIFLGRHSYALGTLTESDGWRLYGLRLLIFPQPLGTQTLAQSLVCYTLSEVYRLPVRTYAATTPKRAI